MCSGLLANLILISSMFSNNHYLTVSGICYLLITCSIIFVQITNAENIKQSGTIQPRYQKVHLASNQNEQESKEIKPSIAKQVVKNNDTVQMIIEKGDESDTTTDNWTITESPEYDSNSGTDNCISPSSTEHNLIEDAMEELEEIEQYVGNNVEKIFHFNNSTDNVSAASPLADGTASNTFNVSKETVKPTKNKINIKPWLTNKNDVDFNILNPTNNKNVTVAKSTTRGKKPITVSGTALSKETFVHASSSKEEMDDLSTEFYEKYFKNSISLAWKLFVLLLLIGMLMISIIGFAIEKYRKRNINDTSDIRFPLEDVTVNSSSQVYLPVLDTSKTYHIIKD